MAPLEYDVARLDFTDPAVAERQAGFIRAVQRSFHSPRPGAEVVSRYVDMYAEDHVRATGIWLADGAFGAGPDPVATYLSFDGTLNTGASLLPVWMITDVTVSPAHRRRGLLTGMMTADLDEAVAAGAPLAALTASEGTIYGRFGFGPSSWLEKVRVDLGPRFALRHEVPGIRVELVRGEDLGRIPEDNFEALHHATRGSISRPAFYRPWVRGDLDPDTGERDPKVHCAVAVDADENPVGHVSWRHLHDKDGVHTIDLVDLVGRTPAAHLALWRFVAGIDLVDHAEVSMSLTDPLRWALVDPRTIRGRNRYDLLWLRVLDVPAALTARPWHGNGQVALTVTDRLGHADGTWTVTVTDGRAEVAPGGRDAVSLDVEALSSMYLGGVDVGTLVAAGRASGSTGSVGHLATLLGDGQQPSTRTFF